jgi:hypothetical protein
MLSILILLVAAPSERAGVQRQLGTAGEGPDSAVPGH